MIIFDRACCSISSPLSESVSGAARVITYGSESFGPDTCSKLVSKDFRGDLPGFGDCCSGLVGGLRLEGFGDLGEGFGVARGLRLEGSGVAASFLLEGLGVLSTFGLEGFGLEGFGVEGFGVEGFGVAGFGVEGFGVEGFRFRRLDFGVEALGLEGSCTCFGVFGGSGLVVFSRLGSGLDSFWVSGISF